MILTCPNCSTRYQADAAKFPAAGRNVRCAKCAQVWRQMPPPVEPEPELAIVTAEAFAPARDARPAMVARSEPRPVNARAEPAPVVARPVPPPRIVQRTEAPPVSRIQPAPQVSAFAPRVEPTEVDAQAVVQPVSLFARVATAAGWTSLVLVVLLVGWATISFRGNVVGFWPQSASLYRALGLSLNATGLQLEGVTNHVETEGGAHVLIVSGRLINNSNRELPVPSLRIALTDLAQHELYHWPVPPNVSTLRPGGITTFQARLAHPPGDMHDVEVTFARADE